MEVRELIREASMTDNIRPRRPEIQRHANQDERSVKSLGTWHHPYCLSDPFKSASCECVWHIYALMLAMQPEWRLLSFGKAIYSSDRATLELLEHRYFFCECCLIKCWNKKERLSPTVTKIIALVCRQVLTCLGYICKPVVWKKRKFLLLFENQSKPLFQMVWSSQHSMGKYCSILIILFTTVIIWWASTKDTREVPWSVWYRNLSV